MWTSRINKLFYVALVGWFLIFSLPASYKFAVYTPNFLGYCMISLFFISILALLFLLIYRIVKQGFLKGIKASSLNIFSMLLILTASFFILKAYVRVANKITVDVYNGSAFKISNIKLFGRKTLSEMDTLLPNEKKTFFFYGKNAIDNLENDFENEIDMRFLIQNKWYEKSILKGFHRHRFLNDTMKIIFYDRDSVRINF